MLVLPHVHHRTIYNACKPRSVLGVNAGETLAPGSVSERQTHLKL